MNRTDLEGELEKLHGASYAWALGCCRRNREEAEDVLQESYLKILEGRAAYRGEAAFKTFMFGVIRRTAAESRRKEWMRHLRLVTWRPAATEPAAPPDSDGQDIARLRGGLARLATRQREVLDLVFGHDMTIEQAAGTLGISVGTARVHYERGKKRLRLLLGESAP